MKTLYLIRHAKSSWNNSELTDFDRPLNERGKKDVIIMGQKLIQRNVLPDIIISSSAKRTRKTTKSIANIIGFNETINYEKDLYLSSPQVLLSFTNKIADINSSAFIIAHNPGISSFCDYLTDAFYDFPTCAIAKISFEVDSWNEISAGLGVLEWFDYPKNK